MLCMLLGVGNAWAEEVTLKYSAGTTTNMTGGNDAVTLGLDASSWSVVGEKGKSNNFPGLNKSNYIALYYHAEGSNTLTVSSLNENVTIQSIAITYTSNSYNNAVVSVGGNVVAVSDGKYDINNSSFVITNGNTSNIQVRISQIVITYTSNGSVKPSPNVTLSPLTIDIDGQATGEYPEELTDFAVQSSDASIAEAVCVDGTITVNGKAAGTATITAIWSETENYNGGSKTFEVTVKEPATIQDGIIDFSLGLDYGSGYDYSAVKVQSGTWTAGNVTLETAGRNCWYTDKKTLRVYKPSGSDAAGTLTFSVPNGKVITSIVFEGKDFNQLTASTGEFNESWSGLANKVVFTAESASSTIQIEKIIVTYSDGEAPATISAPTFNPAAGEVEAGTTVSIVCPADATGVEYSLDNSTWQTYSEPIEINEATTVYARAYNDEGTKSEVVSAAYTIKEDTPAYETVTLPYEETFSSSIGKFVIEDKSLGEGLTYVWKHDNSYNYMKASAFVSGTAYAAESWLVSPLVDLTENTGAANLTFEHATNFFTDINTAKTEATVWVREENGNWEQLEVNYPESLSWTFVESGVIDLKSYNGKKIQIGFKYTSTAEKAGTWEVKNINIFANIKEDAGLAYSVANYTATIGEENEFPTLTNPNGLDVTYSSTNESVATIDNEGNITLVAAGQATIKAASEETDEYKAGQASYMLVVKEKEVAGTDKFELVTDVTTLSDGDVVILVASNEVEENVSYYALSTTQNSNNRAANEVTVNEDNTITPGSSIQQITLEEGFYFNVGNGYLYAASSSSNHMKTEKEADDNAKAEISIDENGDATIVFQGANTRNLMRFNPNSGNPIFSCYASTSTTGSLVRIYRKVASTEPEPLKGDVNRDGKQSIADVTALVNIILGKVTEDNNPDDYDFKAADVNNDGSRSIADVTALVNIILGKTE